MDSPVAKKKRQKKKKKEKILSKNASEEDRINNKKVEPQSKVLRDIHHPTMTIYSSSMSTSA